LSLEPAESSSPAGDVARTASDESSSDAKAQRDLRIRTADEFLAQAAKEYQEGRVDQALWRRAADQGANDASLVIAAYLRARATALQLQQKQKEVSQGPASRTGPTRAVNGRHGEAEPAAESDSDEEARAPFLGMRPLVKYSAAGVLLLAALVAVVWFMTAPPEIGSMPQPVASAPLPPPVAPASPLPPGTDQAVAAATDQGDLHPKFEAQMQELKQAGNWNVLVLYASDWTRKEPNNATAWHELSVGYAKMRQLDDAFHAATKAVQLSPADALLWNNLGQVNLSLERLPEAEVAFGRALALRPDDPDAVCGAALVAQRQGRSSDAEALVKTTAGGCSGVNTPATVKR